MTTEPQARWVLPIGDGRTISRAVARRAPLVDPNMIEEALVTAARGPTDTTGRAVVFGFNARGRVALAHLPTNTAGLTGERAAAVRWLRLTPRAHWRRVEVTAPEAAQ